MTKSFEQYLIDEFSPKAKSVQEFLGKIYELQEKHSDYYGKSLNYFREKFLEAVLEEFCSEVTRCLKIVNSKVEVFSGYKISNDLGQAYYGVEVADKDQYEYIEVEEVEKRYQHFGEGLDITEILRDCSGHLQNSIGYALEFDYEDEQQ